MGSVAQTMTADEDEKPIIETIDIESELVKLESNSIQLCDTS